MDCFVFESTHCLSIFLNLMSHVIIFINVFCRSDYLRGINPLILFTFYEYLKFCSDTVLPTGLNSVNMLLYNMYKLDKIYF